MKKIKVLNLFIILALCAVLALTMFSCKKDGQQGTGSDDVSPETQKQKISISVFENGVYAVDLVYDGDVLLTKDVDRLAAAFDSSLGAKPKLVKDNESSPNAETFELLVGSTDREESASCVADVDESDAWYFAGVIGNKIVINGSNDYMLGLAIDAFCEKYLSEQAQSLVITNETEEKTVWEDFSTDEWLMHELPYYQGNLPRYSFSMYDSTEMLTNRYDESAERTRMMAISKTNAEEFNQYVARLNAFGYKTVDSETIDENVYVTLSNGEYSVHTYYMNSTVKVILDKESALPADISVAMPATPVTTPALYQYGLNQNAGKIPASGYPEGDPGGMLYIARCADNSIIIIDGGTPYQRDAAKLNDFLHEITNTPAGGKITVSTWFISHLHADHYRGIDEFLKTYHAQYELKSICTNINFDFSDAKDTSTETLAEFINTTYPDCKEVKLHTGQKVEIAGVSMQVMFTHEDSVNLSSGNSDKGGVSLNHTGIVTKWDIGGMTALLLADALGSTEEKLVEMYTDAALKSDVVQIAHHSLNGASPAIYEKIDADICLVPGSFGVYVGRYVDEEQLSIYPDLKPIIEASTAYFSGRVEFTVGLAKVDGNITVVYTPEPTPENPYGLKLEITKDTETKWNEPDILG